MKNDVFTGYSLSALLQLHSPLLLESSKLHATAMSKFAVVFTLSF